MAAGVHGVTVSFPSVLDFDQLSLDDATRVVYDQVIPACEAQGIKLSKYGNHAAPSSSVPIAEYDQQKAARQLFDVARIQRVFAQLDGIVQEASKYKIGSYTLKHRVEKYQHNKVTNGDTIVAMLVKGYAARFGKKNVGMTVNCVFKATSSIPA
jgi:hypothetical protein